MVRLRLKRWSLERVFSINPKVKMNAGVQERFHAGMSPQKIYFSHQTFYGLSEMPIPGFILTQFQI